MHMGGQMLLGYIRVALRNLVRDKGYSGINILGLAVGMACCFIIMLFVRFELSYEDFHVNKNSIYRIVPRWISNGVEMAQVWTPAGLAPDLAEQFPQMKSAARYLPFDDEAMMQLEMQPMPRERLSLADPGFLQMFSFELIRGNPETALQSPFSLIISESIAINAFPNDEALGKTIRFDDKHNFTITGVFRDIPANSHLQFSYLGSFVSLKDLTGSEDVLETYGSWRYSTYLWLPVAHDRENYQSLITEFYHAKTESQSRLTTLTLQPLSDIHFTQGLRGDSANGDIAYVYIFSGVAVFILLIACFNFMNLTTARAISRSKEVGVRKTAGAHRRNLITQFLLETTVDSVIALGLSFGLLELIMLPIFTKITGNDLSTTLSHQIPLISVMVATGIFTGLLAGSYPAFYLSSFSPIRALGSSASVSRKSIQRKYVTVFQFGIATFLIIGVIVVASQMDFMKNSKLGFDKEQVIYLEPPDEVLTRYDTFKGNLLQNSGIESIAIANGIPGRLSGHFPYEFHNQAGERTIVSINTLSLDEDYIETLGLEIAEGRNLSNALKSDTDENYLINEAAAKKLGITHPIGQDLQVLNGDRGTGKIVGVVKDFHYTSLHRQIEPLAMWMNPADNRLVVVRISGNDISEILANIEQEWSRVAPAFPFAYRFLDEDFDRLYKSEQRVSEVLTLFAGLAIFIACLGLLGLSAFVTERRTKEIGIRKVLGATVVNITALLSTDFIKLVLIAIVLASPVAWLTMNKWLQNFAYRIEIGWWVFALAGGVALGIALFTVSIQSIRAAFANPVDSLRYE